MDTQPPKTFTITKKISLTQEDIDNIMVSALEGGIGYWATEAEVKKQPEEPYTYASEVISRDGSLKIYDAEEDKWHILTLKKFLKGVAKAEVDLSDVDAPAADTIIQEALFGKQVYA